MIEDAFNVFAEYLRTLAREYSMGERLLIMKIAEAAEQTGKDVGYREWERRMGDDL